LIFIQVVDLDCGAGQGWSAGLPSVRFFGRASTARGMRSGIGWRPGDGGPEGGPASAGYLTVASGRLGCHANPLNSWERQVQSARDTAW